MNDTILILVRHGEAENNILGANFGHSTKHCSLTQKGHEQAKITGEWLRQNFPKIDGFFASDFRRTKQTIRAMFGQEINFTECRTLRERKEGENDGNVNGRVVHFLEKHLRGCEGKTILAVSHITPICGFKALAEQIGLGESMKNMPYNAAVAIFRVSGSKIKMEQFNIIPWEGKL